MTNEPERNLGIAGGLTRAFITSPLTPLFLIAAFAFGLIALATHTGVGEHRDARKDGSEIATPPARGGNLASAVIAIVHPAAT